MHTANPLDLSVSSAGKRADSPSDLGGSSRGVNCLSKTSEMLRDIHPRLRVWQYEGLRGTRQCVWAGSKWHLRAMPGKCGAGPRGTNMRREHNLLPGVAINELYRPAIPLVTSFATAWGQGESPQTGLVPISLSVHTYPQILKDSESHPAP